MIGKYLTRAETVAYLRERGLPFTEGTLRTYASTGRGPAYKRIGYRSMYLVKDLERFVRVMTKPYVITPAQSVKGRKRRATRSHGAGA